MLNKTSIWEIIASIFFTLFFNCLPEKTTDPLIKNESKRLLPDESNNKNNQLQAYESVCMLTEVAKTYSGKP